MREAVSGYLLGCFDFDIQPLPSPEKTHTHYRSRCCCIRKDKRYKEGALTVWLFIRERQETKDSHDDASTGSESVKKRKVGDAGAYKKDICCQMQQSKLSNQEQVETQRILRSGLDEWRRAPYLRTADDPFCLAVGKY
ncbi:hypothetical protein RHGRI_000688 [Rhododendron griersonianum]|uniref:Uncharacterized protein n=1 Tax=Rhododendron griersonianum TaxID=479676 RepID=A0AAV6LJT6_9ERIC|nr:hypothetical protein RHGRI_000688 [Rhododendron griersonianum]